MRKKLLWVIRQADPEKQKGRLCYVYKTEKAARARFAQKEILYPGRYELARICEVRLRRDYRPWNFFRVCQPWVNIWYPLPTQSESTESL